MKKFLVILFLLVSTLSYSQETTTFILVRHAEKASDGTSDPALTDAGIARANNLFALLKQAEITAIYSTNYKRTKMTVAALAKAKEMEVTTYDPKKLKEFSLDLLKENAGGTVVISGHSNTTPTLANLLLGAETFKQFEDSDYGNLIIISTSSSASPKLLHLKY